MTVDIKKLFNYWLTEAEISWDVTLSLIKNGKYAEAMFFGHLTVEKILKALVVAQQKEHAPPIHNLVELIKKTGITYSSANLSDLSTFNSFYMAGRYDEEKMEFRKKCTKTFSEANLKKMQEYYLWLKKEAQNKSR